MQKRLVLIAHAETSATRRGVFPSGESLVPRGREATAQLAAGLPKNAAALTSPAPAAQETAEALGLKADIEPALADLDVGEWTGRSVMEIGVADAEGATAWMNDPAFNGHGGESFETLLSRVGVWLAARTATEGVTIGVTHAAILRAAAIAAIGADAAAFWRIEAAPLARLVLGSNGARWVMRELSQP